MITVHAKDAFYINKVDLPPKAIDRIINKYRLLFFEEKACAGCEFYKDRLEAKNGLTPTCEECAAFKGGTELATKHKIKDKIYIRTPIGDKKGLEQVLDRYDLEPKYRPQFPTTEMKRKFRFTGTYRGKYQGEAVSAILKRKRGVIKAPPRSGKTVMGAAAIAKIGKKTLILASQREWLKGFEETFIGSESQKALTTCRRSQIGFCKTVADFKKYDVCLATVQSFYNERGEAVLNKIRHMFPVVFADEIHTAAAPKYAKVLSILNCQYKIGLSGTPSRKDGRFSIMRNLMGPNIYEAKVKRLRPHVRLVRTAYAPQYKGQVPWTRIVSAMEKNPERLKLIAEWAVKDAKDGHMVLIPLTQVTPIKALVKAINIIAGKTIAYPFWGGLTGKMMYKGKMTPRREVYLQAARAYKIKVLVGNTKILSTGTNIPRASALYEGLLSSNLENCEQRVSRILTPFDGKPNTLLRIFLDDFAVRKRCMSNEWFRCIKPKFRPVISEKDNQVLEAYFSNKKTHERIEL